MDLQVVGGATGGGILVREGEKLGSAELPQRLATGAIIRQKDPLKRWEVGELVKWVPCSHVAMVERRMVVA